MRLVLSLYDINFDSIAKSIDLFNKFLHDIFELKFLLQRYIINQFLSSICFQNILVNFDSFRCAESAISDYLCIFGFAEYDNKR